MTSWWNGAAGSIAQDGNRPVRDRVLSFTPMRRGAVVLVMFTTPLALGAQEMTLVAGPVRVVPTGQLAHYVAPGWGGAGSLTWRRSEHHVGVRIEASYVDFPFGPADHSDHPAPSQVPVLLNSGSTRLTLLAGPELVTRVGPVRGRFHVLAGPTGAFTAMALAGLGTDERYSRRKRFSDLAGAVQTGVGIEVSLARGLALELSAAYGVLSPTSYGLMNQVRVGVISGPYWGPQRRWSQYVGSRLGVAFVLGR